MSKKRMNVKAIHGKIRLVTDSECPDFRVKVVKRFPDLKVQVVDACPVGYFSLCILTKCLLHRYFPGAAGFNQSISHIM
jgi:hypothetical protein